MSSFQSLLNVAIPVIAFFLMTLVGMDLTFSDFWKVIRSRKALIIGTLGQYLLSLAALFTIVLLRPEHSVTGGMMLIASAPGGGISNYYSYIARVNVALSVVLTTVSCVAATITMPTILKLFEFFLGFKIDFHIPFKILLGQLVILLLVPVIIGIVLRNYLPDFVAKYNKILRRIGLLGLACLIGFVIYQTRQLFVINWRGIGEAAALFILFSMILGYVTGIVGRLSRNDAFTLLIEYGVRNIAIATTAAVVILKKTEFAAFAATYFLIEAILILSAIFVFRRFFQKPSSSRFDLTLEQDLIYPKTSK